MNFGGPLHSWISADQDEISVGETIDVKSRGGRLEKNEEEGKMMVESSGWWDCTDRCALLIST